MKKENITIDSTNIKKIRNYYDKLHANNANILGQNWN